MTCPCGHVDAAEARLEAVKALHRSDGYASPTCWGCGREWPCPTIRALNEPDTAHPDDLLGALRVADDQFGKQLDFDELEEFDYCRATICPCGGSGKGGGGCSCDPPFSGRP